MVKVKSLRSSCSQPEVSISFSLVIRPDSPYLLCCCGRSPLLTQQRVCFTFPAEAGTHLELLGREDAMGIKCLAQGHNAWMADSGLELTTLGLWVRGFNRSATRFQVVIWLIQLILCQNGGKFEGNIFGLFGFSSKWRTKTYNIILKYLDPVTQWRI